MQVFSHNDNVYLHQLDAQYALFIPIIDELIIDTPISILHKAAIIDEDHRNDDLAYISQPPVMYVYRVRAGIPSFHLDIWNNVQETMDILVDMFIGEKYCEGDVYYDNVKMLRYVRIKNKWEPLLGSHVE